VAFRNNPTFMILEITQILSSGPLSENDAAVANTASRIMHDQGSASLGFPRPRGAAPNATFRRCPKFIRVSQEGCQPTKSLAHSMAKAAKKTHKTAFAARSSHRPSLGESGSPPVSFTVAGP
jgi:hypothetical protein